MTSHKTRAQNGRMDHRGGLEECHPLMVFQGPVPTRNNLFTPSRMPEAIETVAVCAPTLPQAGPEEMYREALHA